MAATARARRSRPAPASGSARARSSRSVCSTRLAARADRVRADDLVAELARDAERLRVAVRSRPTTATSAPSRSNASCSTAARISVPSPWPCHARAEPRAGVDRRVARRNRFARATGRRSAARVERDELERPVLGRAVAQALSGARRRRDELRSVASSVHGDLERHHVGSWMPGARDSPSARSSASRRRAAARAAACARGGASAGAGSSVLKWRSPTTSKPSLA